MVAIFLQAPMYSNRIHAENLTTQQDDFQQHISFTQIIFWDQIAGLVVNYGISNTTVLEIP